MSKSKDSSMLTETIVDQIKLMKEALNKNATNIISEMIKEDEDEETEVADYTTDEVEVENTDQESETDEVESEEETTPETDETESEEETPTDELELDGEFDLTDASEEEILTIYKKLTDDDEIEVIDNGDSLELDVKVPGEYIIKDEDKSDDDNEDISIDDISDSDEEVEYEIDESDLEEVLNEILNEKEKIDEDEEVEINEEDIEEEVDSDTDVKEEEVVDEKMSKAMSDRHSQQVRPDSIEPLGRSLSESVDKTIYDDLKQRYDIVMEEKKEISKSVAKLKSLLHEAVLSNANLAYFTRLVTENVTSKDEKKTLLERFDSVSTVTESKELFLTIQRELKNNSKNKKNNINESSDKLSSSYSGVIKENVTYVNPDLAKMINMMDELDKRK